ncbi:MAG: ATP-binding cassette domain-containing protein [Myxococcota bacterium]
MQILLRGVSFAYRDSVPLLSDVNLRLGPGWTGVVGANGSGKTTLLRLIARALEPEQGSVQHEPRTLELRLCPQRVDDASPEIEALAATHDGVARRLRAQLALREEELARWPTLSPGERKRWQIGAALAARPSLLILDEPTNHLDAEARAVLVPVLERFAGIGVLVSHDRELLDALSRETVRVARGRATPYRGSYTAARQTWQHDEAALRAEHASLRDATRALERRIGERQTDFKHAEARMRTSKRMKGIHDSSARGRFKQTRRRSAMTQIGHEIARTHSVLERTREKLDAIELGKDVGRDLYLDFTPAKAARLAVVQAAQIRAGERVLLERVDLAFERGSRVWLRGANGSGKTTLLQAFARAASVAPERLLLLPQELGAAHERALLDEARALGADARGRLMALVAALGVEPRALLASAQPSPGEARKLAIALGLSRQVYGCLLDEPTNHLDLPSIERLESALASYPGALLLVTHDARLAARCTNVSWRVADRSIVVASEPAASDRL